MTPRIFWTILMVVNLGIATAQTTMEEYTYITETYEIQVRNGLGMKAGYSLDTLGKWGLLDSDKKYLRTFQFEGLKQTTTNNTKAILVEFELTKVSDSTKTYKYFCIPHPDSEQAVKEKSYFKFCGLDTKSYQAYSWALINYLQYYDDIFE